MCRQFTPGERQALLKPGFEAHPVDVYQEVLNMLPQAAGEVSGKVGFRGGRAFRVVGFSGCTF